MCFHFSVKITGLTIFPTRTTFFQNQKCKSNRWRPWIAESTALAQTETRNYVINITFPSAWPNTLVCTVTSRPHNCDSIPLVFNDSYVKPQNSWPCTSWGGLPARLEMILFHLLISTGRTEADKWRGAVSAFSTFHKQSADDLGRPGLETTLVEDRE